MEIALIAQTRYTAHYMIVTSLEQAGCRIEHHFNAGVYAKEVHIPKGVVLFQHVHKFDHMSILAQGTVVLRTPKRDERIVGPKSLCIPGGVPHEVHALTDAVWFCVHATEHPEIEEN